MRSSLGLLLFIVIMVADLTKAEDEKDSPDEQHGNDYFIQPRKTSFKVNLDSRSRLEVTIESPNFPNKYPSKTQVNWNVTATENPKRIELYFPFFKLRPRNKKGECTDYLEIVDGDLMTMFCGKELNKQTFTSSKRKNKRYNGFNCNISPFTPDCNCGVYTPPIARDDKIVGGNDTMDNQFPWQAIMVRYGYSSLRCGGSLINNQWVLTAAHCTKGLVASSIQILLGEWCRSISSPGLRRLDVIEIIQNAGYNPSTFDNDIALLKLDSRIDFLQTQFRPVCLPIESNDPIPDEEDVEAVISGFGRLESGGNLPDCQQYAIVPTMNNTACRDAYGSSSITDNMICAGVHGVGGIDSCQGDSGGPMVTNATSDSLVNYYVQIGVVSWGRGCGLPAYPGVYARVTEYIDWIHTSTDWSAGSTCPPPA